MDVRIAAGTDAANDPIGEYGGKLSNSSETITLIAEDGSTIRQVRYDDEWHAAADGEGNSLEIVDANESNTLQLNSAALWQASLSIGGTPGEFSTANVLGDLNGDQQATTDDVDLLYAVIANNDSASIYDLNGDGAVNNADADFLIEDIIGILRGDTDSDGDVDFADFLALSANFGLQSNWRGGNFDGDETVTFADFLLLSAVFGSEQ